MLSRTRRLARVARILSTRQIWPQQPLRLYTSGRSDGPQWFQELRDEMLQRDVTCALENITAQPEHRLSNTLVGYLPQDWCRPPVFTNPVLPVGHHLIWLNPALPTGQLLPDGTDASHSPGGLWVRRMWAGGSLHLKPDIYFHAKHGFTIDTVIAGAERIKDVRLRGEGDAAKLFVTIERRFARLDTLYSSYASAHSDSERIDGANVQTHFKQQLRDDEEWGDALFKEERTLVFLKERTTAELDAIEAGHMAAVKYLDPPGKPDFSHTLTPTRSLLFRFSALTFNAHLIHLDREYARNVEGHRNLLVHGPLTLTLIMQVMATHVDTQTAGDEVIERIEYRNLAPLYCDEELRICCREKKIGRNGRQYDVWVEGPTGGAAVIGTVYTAVNKLRNLQRLKDVGKSTPSTYRGMRRLTLLSTEQDDSSVRTNLRKDMSSTPKHESSTTAPVPVTPRQPKANNNAPHPDQSPRRSPKRESRSLPTYTSFVTPQAHKTSPKLSLSPSSSADRVYRQNPRPQRRLHQFITINNSTPSIRHVNSIKPVKPTASFRSRSIMHRLFNRTATINTVKPVPILRKYPATPYKLDASRTTSGKSSFRRQGVKHIEKLKVRLVAQALEAVESARRGRGAY